MSTPATNLPPPRKEEQGLRGILGVLLAVLAVALVLIFAAVYVGGRYLARNVRIDVRERDEGKRVRIETPAGELKVESGKAVSSESLGLPMYPGAVAQKKGAAVSVGVGEEEGGSVLAQVYETPDLPERVADWYRKKLGPGFKMTHERSHGGGGEAVIFQSETEERHRIVVVHRKGNVTQIALTAVTEKNPQ